MSCPSFTLTKQINEDDPNVIDYFLTSLSINGSSRIKIHSGAIVSYDVVPDVEVTENNIIVRQSAFNIVSKEIVAKFYIGNANFKLVDLT